MLNDYVDGLLDAERRTAVERHVESCSSCREELEQLKSVRRKLNQLQHLPAPPDMLSRVHRGLDEERSTRFSFRKSGSPLRVAVPAGVAALATAAIAFVVVLSMIEPRSIKRDITAGDGAEMVVERERQPAEAPSAKPAPEAGMDMTAEQDAPDEVTSGDIQKLEEVSNEGKVEDEAVAERKHQAPDTEKTELAAAGDSRESPVIVLRRAPATGTVREEYKGFDAPGGEPDIRGVRAGAVKSSSLEKSAIEEDVVAFVEQLASGRGGRVVSKDYGKEGAIPQSMVVEIPVEAVDAFIRELLQYGEAGAGNGVILPDEISSGAYRSLVTADVETLSLKISFE
jgi:hypothetical protein